MDKAIVDFDRPPVTEVICGIGFKEPSGFQAPHMGLEFAGFDTRAEDVAALIAAARAHAGAAPAPTQGP